MDILELGEAQHSLFDRVSDAIVVLDAKRPDLPITATNRACRDILACDDDAIVGRPWDAVFVQACEHNIADHLRRCVATGEPFAVQEVPYLTGPAVREPWVPQQLTYWNWQGWLVRDAGGGHGHLVLIMADVTARATIAQISEERAAFLSLISHEIKSPLTAIRGFAQLATRATAGSEGATGRTARYLKAIDQQTERIVHLLGNLSDVARLQGGRLSLNPAQFDLAALVRRVIAQRPQGPGVPDIEVAFSGDSLPVCADQARIEQALTNLLANAEKYSPESQAIVVKLDCQGDSAHLTIRDRGIGIPRDELPRIFGRFYRATNGAAHGRGGLGLGLFIAQQIITRSGGQIYAESDMGRGSTFHVVLPTARAHGARQQAAGAAASRSSASRPSRPTLRVAGT